MSSESRPGKDGADPAWKIEEVQTPIGALRVEYRGKEVRSLDFLRETSTLELPRPVPPEPPRYARGSPPAQIVEYFQGSRKAFDFEPIFPASSDFDRQAWAALQRIPYGETRTYGQLAKSIGRPRAARAVGGAMHRNPIALMVPCHRVVGSDGNLTGFGPGVPKKEWLLRHEGAGSAHPPVRRSAH